MPKKFDREAKDRVVRLVEDRILAESISTQEACKIVAPKLGVSWHTARQWTQPARREGRVSERLPEGLVAEVAKLLRDNHQLRDTNELLKAASAFSHPNSTEKR
ncbi:transposase [Corynebacterium striatum]|uniref:transposase n=1 Tax=Corynebacterium striatum TaxID=43770 RepID=UPI0015583F2D|nr:transposase [Corynebacterium striatum]